MDQVWIKAEKRWGEAASVAISDKPELLIREEYMQQVEECAVELLAEVARLLGGEDGALVLRLLAKQAKEHL